MKHKANLIILIIISLLVRENLTMFEFLKFCSKTDQNTTSYQEKRDKAKMKKNYMKSKQKNKKYTNDIFIESEIPSNGLKHSEEQDFYTQNSMANHIQNKKAEKDYLNEKDINAGYLTKNQIINKKSPVNDNIFSQSSMVQNKIIPNSLPQSLQSRTKNLKDISVDPLAQKSDVLLEMDFSPIKAKNLGQLSKIQDNASHVKKSKIVDNESFADSILNTSHHQLTRGQRKIDKLKNHAITQQKKMMNETIMLNDQSQKDFDEMSVVFGFDENNESQSENDLQENFLQTKQESTLLNKTILDDFDAERALEKLGQSESFIGEDKSNLIPSVTNFIQRMKEDVKQEVFDLVNHQMIEAKKEQNTAALGLDKYFQNMFMKNRRQRNCVFFQEMLKAMPSQRKTWTRKIKNFFSSSKVNNLKSYRTLAIDMVLNIEVNAAEKEQLRSLVEQYRLAKGLYYSQYMVGWKANLDVELDEKENLHSLITKQTRVVEKKKLEFDKFKTQYLDNQMQLGFLVEQMLATNIQDTMEEKAKFKKLMEIVIDSKEGLPDENFKEFGKQSAMGKMVIDFNKAISSFLKWSAIEGALTHHFLNKKKLGLSIYTIETERNLLQNVLKRVNNIQIYFSKKAESMRTKLTNYLKEYVDELGNQIGNNQHYSQYSALILSTAKILEQKEQAEATYLEEKMKLEEAKFKAQKLDFTDNFDYVFPSGLIMSLQKKKREFETILERYPEGSGYFTLNDSDIYLKISEDNKFKQFFRSESEDIIKTLDRVDKQLNIAVEIDSIEGEIDFFLGSILSRTNSVVEGKGCFSLSQISYFVFLLFKTNVIAKQTRFLEGFFGQMDEKLTKEFVIFNYMLFTPQDYVDDLLERYKNSYSKNQPSLNKVERKDFFTADYIMNYSIMVNFYKDMTEFGTAENGIVKKSRNFVKSLLNLGMTYLNGNLNKIEEKGMEKVVDFLTETVTEAFAFLSSIPFAEDLVKGAIKVVLEQLIEYLSAFFNGVSQYFSRRHGEKVKEQMDEVARQDFFLDFDEEIKKLIAPDDNKKSASFDQESTIAEMEKKYLDSIAATSSVFNKLQNLSTFKDKDYQSKAQKIFDNNEQICAQNTFNKII